MTILVIVFIYIFVFQATVGQVTWVLNSEIFPPQYSAACTGISVFSLWAANFVVSLVFPLMREAIPVRHGPSAGDQGRAAGTNRRLLHLSLRRTLTRLPWTTRDRSFAACI